MGVGPQGPNKNLLHPGCSETREPGPLRLRNSPLPKSGDKPRYIFYKGRLRPGLTRLLAAGQGGRDES